LTGSRALGFAKQAGVGLFGRAAAAVSAIGKGLSGAGNPLTGGAVAKRMVTRSLVGAGIGAGTSMIGDKLRGEEISGSKAVGRGLLGAGIGAVAGTTMGKRLIRRGTAPHSTPSLSFGQAVNPMNWGKAMGGSKFTKPTTAWGALGPLEKGFVALSGVDAAKAMIKPDEHSGERIGGAVGNAAAMLSAGRWKGVRRPWPGGSGLGATARSMGLYAGGDIAGRTIGHQFDKMRKPKQEVSDVPQ
jgi:hypothetical protein